MRKYVQIHVHTFATDSKRIFLQLGFLCRVLYDIMTMHKYPNAFYSHSTDSTPYLLGLGIGAARTSLFVCELIFMPEDFILSSSPHDSRRCA